MSASRRPAGWQPRVLRPGLLLAAAVVAVLVPLLLPEIASAQQGVSPEALEVLKNPRWTNGILDRTAQGFLEPQAKWAEAAVAVATPIYAALGVLELIISGYGWAMKSESPDVILRELAKKCLLLSFGFVLLKKHDMFLTPVVKGLGNAGGCIGRGLTSGACMESSSTIMGQGFTMSLKILFGVFASAEPADPADPSSSSSFSAGLESLVDGTRRLMAFINDIPLFIAGFAITGVLALVVLLAFTLIVAQMFKTTIEAAIVLGVGVFLLGFAGSRITAGIAEGFVGYAVETGMRFFMLNAIVGVGATMVSKWDTLLDNAFWSVPGVPMWWVVPNYPVLLEVSLGVCLFAYLAYSLPNRFASVATQKLSFGLQQAMSS